MSGIVGNLFGSKGARAESTTPTSYNTLPGFAQDAFQQGVTGIQGLASDPNNANLFGSAPLSSGQNQALGLSQQGFTPINADTVNPLTQSFMNPYTQNVVDTTNQQILKANAGLLNQIGGDANSVGAFGGTRQGAAQSLQNYNTLNTLAATDAGLNSAGFNNAQNNAISSIGANNNALNSQISNLMGIGGTQQATQTSQNQAPLTALQTLLAASQGVPVGGGNTNLGAQADQGFLSRLGSASGGIAAIGSLFSDIRLKNNIRLVGRMNGHNIYDFNYNGMSGRYRGVMAQEVAQTHPHAVKLVGGYLAVDYGALGFEMVRVL